jgi:signal transduction histidine kinase
MTVPIFDKRGNMTGFLGGGIDLLGENFLADLATVKIGKTGYVYITDSNRIMIVHPDQNRIMKNAGLPGLNKLHERALNGFEGSGETVNTSGIVMLSSFKHLTKTQWILAANYPISEAYAPMYRAERYFEISVVVAMVILLLITWLIMKRLMLPLSAITRHVKHLPEKPRQEHHIVIDSLDEIGILATAFNTMIDTLDSQHEKLHENAILLEKEIAERQMAQEELVVEQQQLEKMNSMLYEFNNDLDERITQKVSELRQKDQILIRQNRQAAMGDMINNIAHQWRQPLNSIGLIVQSMIYSYEGGGLTEEMMKADVDKAMETIKFMSQTIDDFRNYFKPDKEKTQFNVKMVINRSISIVAGSIGNVKITIDSVDAVDPVIYGYPNEYSQVVLNILINARDALSERKISNPEIKIVICTENGKSVVTVSDNAGGIPEDIIDKIFDPYFSTKGPDTGTGVGLFMSKNIIEENMNGRLTVCNSGEGAEFRIEI